MSQTGTAAYLSSQMGSAEEEVGDEGVFSEKPQDSKTEHQQGSHQGPYSLAKTFGSLSENNRDIGRG